MKTEVAQFKRRQGHRAKKARGSKAEIATYFLLIKLASLIPYRVGVWIIREMSRSWLLQRTLFRQPVRRLERFMAVVAEPLDQNRAVERHLVGKAFKWLYIWRLLMVGRADWSSLREWFVVTGLEELERAHATGRGVILVNSHFGGGRFVPLVLARRMGLELLSLEAGDKFDGLGVKLPDSVQVIPLRNSFLARVVFQAEKALKKGKVVHLAADGRRGDSGFVLTFHGRQRHFAAGFAELAVNTGAVVLPVFAPFDEEGRVNIEFLEPLDSGSESMAHSERVESLVRQYARLLEQRWSQDPGNVRPRLAGKFLSLPVDQAMGSAAVPNGPRMHFECTSQAEHALGQEQT
jgi:lauroyl/myristoyl acyltransferase